MLVEVPKRPYTSRKDHVKERQMREPWTSERETPGQLLFPCEVGEQGAAEEREQAIRAAGTAKNNRAICSWF